MKTKLITALRTAAKAIDEGTFDYEWNYANRCNCGIVACALLGKSSSELNKMMPSTKPFTWEAIVGQHCPITGIPTQKMLKELCEAGLTPKDLVQLEMLSNPEVLARMNLKEKPQWREFFGIATPENKMIPLEAEYNNKEHALLYMRTWAELLTEQGALDMPEKELTPSPVPGEEA